MNGTVYTLNVYITTYYTSTFFNKYVLYLYVFCVQHIHNYTLLQKKLHLVT